MSKRKEIIILLLVAIVLFVLQVFVTYRFLTSITPGANDYYSRWAGARAMLVEGRNPYGLDVTYEIQEVIDISHEEVGRGGFNYPLHVIFLFLPLVYLPYQWAQAVWWVMLLWMSIGTAVALIALNRLKLSMGILLAGILFVITFYPTVRSIFMGQFTIPVLLFVTLSLLLLQREHDVWAGAFLAMTSIKPQMVLFIAPWILLWVISQKRWRFLWGFFGGGAILFVTSLPFHPRWPLDFIEDTQRYRVFAGGRNPLALLLSYIWPNYPQALYFVLAVPMVLMMLKSWWDGWRGNEQLFYRALHWAIVVELLITFQTGTTNYVLLLIPIFAWLVLTGVLWGRWVTSLLTVGLNVALWVLFFSLLEGSNTEHLFLFLPLPWLSLLVLILLEVVRKRSGLVTAVSHPQETA